MKDVLVLSSGYLPLELISNKDAICLLYQNKAYTVIESDRVMRSPSITMKVPSVVALLENKVIPQRKISFSKLNVIYRDDQTCQYCGKQFPMNELTVDHVIPRSRWKQIKKTHKHNWSSWENCVCACKYCNNAKGNALLEELQWVLLSKPVEPTYMPRIAIPYHIADSRGWLPFCNYNVRFRYN